MKFDDTTVTDRISNNNVPAGRDKVQNLTACCSANNLAVNNKKTQDIVVDFKKTRRINPEPWGNFKCVDS